MKIISSDLLDMSYVQLVKYYLKKFGKVKYDYFCTPECKSRQRKNSRTKEGLEIHHIDENKYPSLNKQDCALICPYECQKADRLVYVNLLEHLLLHIKIYEEQCKKYCYSDKKAILGHPGIIYISNTINDYFMNSLQLSGYRSDMFRVISDYFDDYVLALDYHIRNIEYFFKNDNRKLYNEIKLITNNSNGIKHQKLYDSLISNCKEVFSITIEKNVTHSNTINQIENEQCEIFNVGDKVFHKTFGNGVVKKVVRLKVGSTLTIEFDDVGEKQLVDSYARLKKIKP